MKKNLPGVFLFCFSFLLIKSQAQTIWNGPTMVFSKVAGADFTLPANQDRIANATWITRGAVEGIFNIFAESAYIRHTSPTNTEWATGILANYATLVYKPWKQWADNPHPGVPGIVNQQAVVHLKTENIYIGIMFTSWDVGAGGFSYQRTTAPIVTPVKLASFSVAKKTNALQLNWKTVSEENTLNFSIERSDDGRQFAAIGTVAASGNSTTEKLYSFTDATPLPANFYRLRTNDNNGAINYSNVVAFKLRRNKEIEIFPVPATDVLHIQVTASPQRIIQITDAVGRLVKTVTIGEAANAFTLQIQDLKAGVYFLKMGTGSKRFIKE